MARLTTIGQSLISAAVGSGPKLDITKFVFANIPGLVHTAPEPVDEPMPSPENVVFERAPTLAGIIDENRVTYSQMMLTDIGDFEFNWIGLVQGNDLVMFAYVPLTQKIKTLHPTVGNVLTRNMVIEHLGVANATPVVVSADSWMFDFGDELTLINDRIDAANAEVSALAASLKLVALKVDNTCKVGRNRFMKHSNQKLPIADDESVISFIADWSLDLAIGDCRLVAPTDETIQMADGDHDDVLIKSTGIEFTLHRINGAWRV